MLFSFFSSLHFSFFILCFERGLFVREDIFYRRTKRDGLYEKRGWLLLASAFLMFRRNCFEGTSDGFFLLLKIHTLLNFPAEGFCHGGEYYFSIHNI